LLDDLLLRLAAARPLLVDPSLLDAVLQHEPLGVLGESLGLFGGGALGLRQQLGDQVELRVVHVASSLWMLRILGGAGDISGAISGGGGELRKEGRCGGATDAGGRHAREDAACRRRPASSAAAETSASGPTMLNGASNRAAVARIPVHDQDPMVIRQVCSSSSSSSPSPIQGATSRAGSSMSICPTQGQRSSASEP